MKKLLLIAGVLGLLALAALGTATAKPETDCYIIGDVCVIITNVCFLDSYDCGDGTDWFSKRNWVKGWCMAAIYAEVIVGTVQDCIDGKARTVAEKVPISSVNGMLVLWQSQYIQYKESIANGNQQQQQQRSSANGSSQRSSSSSGNQQQGRQPQGQQQGNQQGDRQNDGNPPPIDPQQPDDNPPQPPILLQPPDKVPEVPPDQEDQEDLLIKVLQQQQEPQYQQAQGPRGEQQPGDSSDCENTITGTGWVSRPSCTPSTPQRRNCDVGALNKEACPGEKCGWVSSTEYDQSDGKWITVYQCSGDRKKDGTCAEPSEIRSSTTKFVTTSPSRTTWNYVCR